MIKLIEELGDEEVRPLHKVTFYDENKEEIEDELINGYYDTYEIGTRLHVRVIHATDYHRGLITYFASGHGTHMYYGLATELPNVYYYSLEEYSEDDEYY